MVDQTTSSGHGTVPSIHVDIRILSGRFRFLWLKSVVQFDPRSHCARCLIGEYSPLLAYGRQPKGARIRGSVRSGSIWYLCGVTGSYERNVHIPFEAGSGMFSVETPDIEVVIEGATLLEFPSLPDGYNGLSSAFTTCRNYQFGEHLVNLGRIQPVAR